MIKEKINILALVLFLIGLLLILSPNTITGAFIGTAISSTSYPIMGFILILVAGAVASMAPIYKKPRKSSLEKKLKLKSGIKKHRTLVRLANKATKNHEVQEDIDHLIFELKRGNFEAEKGKPGHIDKTNIFYLRGQNGGRLYYHRTGEDTYEIIGKSSKGKNQDQVIKKIKEYYSNQSP